MQTAMVHNTALTSREREKSAHRTWEEDSGKALVEGPSAGLAKTLMSFCSKNTTRRHTEYYKWTLNLQMDFVNTKSESVFWGLFWVVTGKKTPQTMTTGSVHKKTSSFWLKVMGQWMVAGVDQSIQQSNNHVFPLAFISLHFYKCGDDLSRSSK